MIEHFKLVIRRGQSQCAQSQSFAHLGPTTCRERTHSLSVKEREQRAATLINVCVPRCREWRAAEACRETDKFLKTRLTHSSRLLEGKQLRLDFTSSQGTTYCCWLPTIDQRPTFLIRQSISVSSSFFHWLDCSTLMLELKLCGFVRCSLKRHGRRAEVDACTRGQ